MKLHCFLLLIPLCLCSRVSAQSVIITEIFADPTPSRGLPEVEFLEIYNASEHDISLKGYSLVYNTTTTAFPDSVLKSQEYAIVCRTTFANQISPYGKVIPLNTFTLNNTAATLKLLNHKNEEIQFISYSNTWYTPDRNDGFSLEMIDINFPCRGKENWSSSLSPEGATPGKPNSIFNKNQDTEPPVLINWALDDTKITLTFNELLNKDYAANLENFEITKGLPEIIHVDFSANQRETIIITLNETTVQDLELIIYNAQDCTGNLAEDFRISFKKMSIPDNGDIQISEVLFNPKTGGQDFVELYNTSKTAFNLKNWQFANLNNQGVVSNFRTISTYDLILEPDNYIAITQDRDFLIQNYPLTGLIVSISSLPAYNNTSGTVILLTPDSLIFDQFSYTEKMHSALINNPKGVSLEKVSFRKNQNKWTSASSDAGYATPGTQNSQNENEYLTQFFEASPIVFNPYQNSENATTSLTYKLNKEANYASIEIIDKNGRNVKNLGKNLLLGTSGSIKWDGRDNYGNLLPVGYYVFVINVFNSSNTERFYAKTVIGSF